VVPRRVSDRDTYPQIKRGYFSYPYPVEEMHCSNGEHKKNIWLKGIYNKYNNPLIERR